MLDYKRELLRCLSIGTGLPVDKLDEVGCVGGVGRALQRVATRGRVQLAAEAQGR